MNIDGAALGGWLAESGVPVDIPIPGVHPRLLERTILGVHDELQLGPEADGVVIRNYLHTCFRQIARVLRGDAVAVAPQLLSARAFLESRYAERITLAILARQVGWSVPHLCQRFRRVFGAAPIDYLIRIRLAQALLLIRDRGLGVAEAAAAVGYDDYHHFTKLYRKRYGHPPSQRAHAVKI
jgi:AraC-like DNA-binding protein